MDEVASEVARNADVRAPLIDLVRELEHAHAEQAMAVARLPLGSEGVAGGDAVVEQAERRVQDLVAKFAAGATSLREVIALEVAGGVDLAAPATEQMEKTVLIIEGHLNSVLRCQAAFERDIVAMFTALRSARLRDAVSLQASIESEGPDVRIGLGQILNCLRASLAECVRDARDFVALVRRLVWFLVAVVLAVTVIGSFWFVRSLVRSLRGIVDGVRAVAERVADDEFKHQPIELREGGEVGEMAAAFNLMGARLEASLAARAAGEADLRQARDTALAAVEAKAQFLANMSHEIRTPLNGVIGMTGLLLETHLASEQRDFTETIRSSGEQLLSLINDILDLSKVEADRMQLESVDFSVRAIVEETLDLMVEQAERKGLEFACLVEEDVEQAHRGDPGRLRQVLINLVGNAVKFTARGEVFVRVSLVERTAEGARLRFEVRDTGIGLTPDQQSKIFQPFVQADASTTRKYGGSGLGLAISRKLVELMGGSLGVDSVPGQGSTFAFIVSLLAPLEAASVQPLMSISLRDRRALVVDDNPTNCRILKAQLSAWGMSVETAADGAQGLCALQAAAQAGTPFEIALLDYLMPELHGLALARAIRADPLVASTKLGLLTSVTWHGDIGAVHAAGIDARLTKPVRRSRLFDAICQLVANGAGEVAPQEPIETAALAALAGLRVLIAEDNPVNQKVLTRMLEKLGCSADAVANGEEAVAAVARLPYDLILMDCQMPEMDGYEATEAIRRRQGEARRSVIVAITANAMDGDRERCCAAGMDDYLAKPVTLAALRSMLAKWAPNTRRRLTAASAAE